MWRNFVLFCLLCLCNFSIAKRQIPFGGIFTIEEVDEEIAFRAIIGRVNNDLLNFELIPIVKYVKFDDSFIQERLACDLIAEGVVAIIGPSSKKNSGIVSSICHNMRIPHVVYGWRDDEHDWEKIERSMTINVFPDSMVLSNTYADIILEYGWNSYVIIYETKEGLMKFQDVLQTINSDGFNIPVIALGEGPDYRQILKKVKLYGYNNFILDCSPSKLKEVLVQAEQINLLGEDHNLFLSNLDTHTFNFHELPAFKVNITAVRLAYPERLIREAIYDWTTHEASQGRRYVVHQDSVKTSMILIQDAIRLFATALLSDYAFKDMDLPYGDCKSNEKWKIGKQVISIMKLITQNNSLPQEDDSYITGRMDLNKFGDRTFFKLDITVLYSQSFHNLISWNPADGFVATHTNKTIHNQIGIAIQNKTFIVSTRLGDPFLIEREPKDGEILEGNDRYEGYSVDLIHSLSQSLGFKYIIALAPDKRYGQYNKKTKKWDGIIKQLIEGKADMGICDLTITYERRQAVDFTVPFMSLGISILYSKPLKEEPNFFSFLSPFSIDVWVNMGLVYLFISALLFGIARISKQEWEPAQITDKKSKEIEGFKNIWNVSNRAWLTMGSLMGQGSDLLPKGIPMRLVTGVWWFFAMMMLNSYTANLAAFLTMSRMEAAIENVEDLSEQTKIKYGVVQGGSTQAFFEDSKDSVYHKMWAAMENARPSVFTQSNEEGMDRVQKGKRLYAFLMESTSLEYITERHCELTEIGSRFGEKFYGIALPMNSRYRTTISQEVLRMSERGEMYDLKMKWWKRTHDDGACIKEIIRTDDNELSLDQVGGVFLVLGTGLFIAFLIGICEFLWSVHKIALNNKVTIQQAFKSQAKFALKFWLRYKPVSMRPKKLSNSRQSSKSSAEMSQQR